MNEYTSIKTLMTWLHLFCWIHMCNTLRAMTFLKSLSSEELTD